MSTKKPPTTIPGTEPHARTYRIDPDSPLPLAELVRADGRSVRELAIAMGYRNLGKGMNLLTRIKQGSTDVKGRLPVLAQALGVPIEVVQKACDDSAYISWAREDRTQRRCFRPYIVWIPEHEADAPMFVRAAVFQPVHFETEMTEPEMVAHAMVIRPVELPLWGSLRGFRIRYTPDREEAYDLTGQVLVEAYHVAARVRMWLGSHRNQSIGLML